MRTLRSLFAGALGALSLAVQLGAGVTFVVGCADLETISPVPTTTSASGGQGGNPDTSSTTAIGSSGGAAATGGTGGNSTGGSATGGNSTGGVGGTGGGSTGGVGGTGGAVAQMVPDFTLVDLNPMSSSAGQEVSPRDYLSRVSAWYFGHST